MLEQLQRWREPAAVVVLVTLGLRLLVALVDLGVLLASQPWGGDTPALAGLSLTYGALDQVTAVLLAVLLACCALWTPTPRARLLTSAAVLVVGLSLLAALVGLVLWIFTVRQDPEPIGTFGRALLGLPVPALALVVLVRLGRSLPAGVHPAPGVPDEAVATPAPAALEPVADVRDEPTWRPDQAAGAAWLTAGEAAAGGAATGWGTPGEQGGWGPRADDRGDDVPQSPATPVQRRPGDDSWYQS